eukprot:scaffold117955_cov99-Phaeocystis_antarctica.AAC.4
MGGTPLFCLGRPGPPAEHFADEVGLQASSAGGAETPRRNKGQGEAGDTVRQIFGGTSLTVLKHSKGASYPK